MRKTMWASVTALLILLSFGPAYGWKMFSANPSDTGQAGLLGNSFVDILFHEGKLWATSGAGLAYSSDSGQTWHTLTTGSGLNSNELSAIFGRPGQLWVSGSHFQMYQGVNYPFGDGFNVSTDTGKNWSSFKPDEASNFAHLVYDITGDDTSTYAACFHGGLIASHDFGETWEHLFYSPSDSGDWAIDDWADQASGRYYSCAIDTTHGDTLVLWAGSARGLQKFLYLPRRDKLGGNRIYGMVGDSTAIFAATDGGVSQADTSLNVVYTSDTLNGLPSNWARKLVRFGGKLWAGVFDPADSTGLGLYFISPDVFSSAAWTNAGTGLFEGEGTGVFDFKNYFDSAFFIAAGDSGVYRSLDSGQTWTRFYVDSAATEAASPHNQVYSIDVTPDSLYLGTKAGLVMAAYTLPFSITYDTLITFPESDGSGSFVSLVRHNSGTRSFTLVAVDPLTPSGHSGSFFHLDTLTYGWAPVFGVSPQGTRVNDIMINDTLTVFATSNGLMFIRGATLEKYQVNDLSTGLTRVNHAFLSTTLVNGRLYAGTVAGCAYRISNANWRIFVANTNPRKHDIAYARTFDNSGLSGDWVVSMAVQPYNDSTTVVWAGCRRVPDTTAQINGVSFSTDFGTTWHNVLPQLQVWNFAYDPSGTVYAAASEGLYYASPPWTDWTRADIIDPVTLDTMVSGTEIFSVEVADTVLWVGTGMGLAHRPLNNPSGWAITRVFAPVESADDVFAAPVPYSPINSSGRLTLHYHAAAATDITVRIYDFSMNLVKTVAENKPRAGGADYFETWDGYNEAGDMVATGIYYFKVSYSTGEERWGRLAIIP